MVCYSVDLWLRLSSQRSHDHIHWFQWLQVAIYHRFGTLVWCHMHLNSQKCLELMIKSTAVSCTILVGAKCIHIIFYIAPTSPPFKIFYQSNMAKK